MSKIATREAYGKALSQLTKENKNIIPLITPTAAGTKESFPIPLDISIAGIINDHTAAAIITPDANPINARCTNG